ncbi:MAG TPA: T9SS type A sorting domain-containing protein [Candidatus Syntrophosphaera sp.]|nr:T9SS type A sorting domain-containing protein [Candidatus Syntrophosphaera sp.]
MNPIPQVVAPPWAAAATYTVNMSTVPAGYITPTTLGPVEDVTTIYGTYTPTAVSATGYWTPASLTIDADTPWVADGDNWVYNQEFVWTEVDYYNYYVTLKVNEGTYTGKANWNVQGPAGSYTVPGGTTGFQVVDETQESVPENAIDGAYQMLTPAPTGYYWEAVELTTGDFLARSKGGRAVINLYAPDMMWMLLENPVVPTYTVFMTTNPAGYITPATLGPVTDPVDIYGTYTPTDVSTTGYWTPASLTIDADTEWVADGDDWVFNQEFVWTETTVNNYYLTLNVDDSQLPVKGTWAITGPAGSYEVIAGTPYPIELLDADTNLLAGEYTIAAAPAGYEWVPSVTQTPVFEPMQMPNKETFNYGASLTWTLQPLGNTYLMVVLSSPTQGYTFTGPDPGVTPHSTNPPVNSVALLTGTYEVTDPAPSGYYWMNPSIVVNAGMFAPQPGNPNVFVCTIVFMYAPLQPITYTLNITIDDTVFPGGPYTINGNPYVTPIVDNDDQVNDLLGDYLISDPPAGYHWEVNPITVADGDFVGNVASIEFVLVEDVNPVELSSFTATLTGQFYVQLSWTSQTETQMMGYRVYRNTSAEQSTSELIDNPMIPATNTSSTQNYTVVDDDVLIGQTYYYWLEAVDYNSSSFHGPVSVTVTGNVPPVLPEVTTMRNAYPNPFKANGSTNIEVSLKAGDTGTLTIYNVQGQLVKTVSLTEGNHMVNWNGRDSRGNACGSGIYFYKLSTQSMNQTKKMVIVK